MDGLQQIFYDGHVNTCVVDKMKEGDRQFKAIMNYFILKFQNHLKDQFVFNKKSIKFLKKRKYKEHKGTAA